MWEQRERAEKKRQKRIKAKEAQRPGPVSAQWPQAQPKPPIQPASAFSLTLFISSAAIDTVRVLDAD